MQRTVRCNVGCQKLDEHIESLKVLTRYLGQEEKEELFFQLQIFDGLYYVVKCEQAKQRVCADEWKKVWSRQGGKASLGYFAELITGEPSEQWLEITCFKLHVKPLWFVGNRVYQFRTQISRPQIDTDAVSYTITYDCKIIVDGYLIQIRTFDFPLRSKLEKLSGQE